MKYVFVGNRRFVLECMIEKKLDIVQAFVVSRTHLERDIQNLKVPSTVVHSKSEFLSALESLEFDVLISNGCPYILPISKMKKRIYANIHPSFLPDLKGVDPVIGAILFQRDGGATCHLMNDQIDEGDIISQVKIPHTIDLDVSLMYQLSFVAEKQAFLQALKRKFLSTKKQTKKKNAIYYSRKPEDRTLSLELSTNELLNRVRAFNNKSQGCLLNHYQKTYRVHELRILKNPFLNKVAKNYKDLEVIFSYEDCLLFKRKKDLILLRSYTDPLSEIRVGAILK